MSDEVIGDAPEITSVQLIVELPGIRPAISVEVDLSTSIGDIKELVSSVPQSRDFTNFSITYDSFKVDETLTLEELIGHHELVAVETLTLHVRQDPYTESSARNHVVKVREILGFKALANKVEFGVSSGLSKFQSIELAEVKAPTQEDASTESQSKEDKELGSEEKSAIMESVSSMLGPHATSLKAPMGQTFGAYQPALRSLALSVWNPPTYAQTIKGDLLYLQAQTLEGETFQITSHVSGFFVNNSSNSSFNPSMKQTTGKTKANKCHSLLELLTQLSPKLQQQLQSIAESFAAQKPEFYLPAGNAFLANPWLVNDSGPLQHPDLANSQMNYLIGGSDGADMTKDWNEEFQSIRELPKSSFAERLMRERLLNRITYEFTAAASKTAVSIFNGELESMNPDADPSLQVFLRNGIFYSFGVDATDAFAESGGNEAARAASTRDLASIRLLNSVDATAVCHILTTVVDYCGKRIVCQAPVPGIFADQPEDGKAANKIAYGLTEGSSELVVDSEFKEKLRPVGEALQMKVHQGWISGNQEAKEIVTSIETKGLRGSDGRDYVIDLYRTSPLDIEFIEKHWNPESENSYPHREVTLRHEAAQEWRQRQTAAAIKRETDKLDAENANKGEAANTDEKPTIAISSTEFALNPDAFSLDTSHISEDVAEDLKDDEVRVREASKFITLQLIPEFISEVASSATIAPIDGRHLVSLLHKRGINVRYLGHLATEVLQAKQDAVNKEEKHKAEILKANEEYVAKPEEAEKITDDQEKKESKANFVPTVFALECLFHAIIQEMVARAMKHVLRDYTSALPLPLVPACIAHFHNCLLGDAVNANPVAEIDNELKALYPEVDYSFAEVTPASLIELLSSEIMIRYRYALPSTWKIDYVKPIPLLREIAMKFGIQWKARDYIFMKKEEAELDTGPIASVKSNNKGKKKNKASSSNATLVSVTHQNVTFHPEDVVGLVPIIKESIFKSALLGEVWEAGRVSLQNEDEKESGLAMLEQAVQLYEQIYGNIHPQVGKAYSVLAQTYLDLGLTDKACDISRKGALILERTFGVDSSDTILALINAAFFEQANENYGNSLKLYSRILEDWDFVSGRDHPSYITTLTNVATLLQKRKLFKEAAAVCEQAAEISGQYNGEQSQITAMLRYQLAQYYLMADEIEPATLEMEKAYSIFKVSVGESDAITEDSKKWVGALKTLKTRRADLKQQKELQKATSSKKVKKTAKPADSRPTGENKKSKKNNIASIPEIAKLTLDEIAAFIEGTGPSKKGKSKN